MATSSWLGGCAAAGPAEKLAAGLHPTTPAVAAGADALLHILALLQPTPAVVAMGAVVAAGAALVPDWDHPQSTIARSLGPVTRIVARLVSWVSDAVRDATCDCCDTPGTHGHRLLTHTTLVAVLVGVGICLAGRQWAIVGPLVAGVGVWLAALGLLPRARRGDRASRWLAGAVAGVAVGVGVHWLGAGMAWWWLGIPAGWGMLAHSLGDAATRGKVPLLAPIKIRGCRWYKIGLPDWLTFRTGGKVETRLVRPLLTLAGCVALGVLLWEPYLAALFEAGRQAYTAAR